METGVRNRKGVHIAGASEVRANFRLRLDR